MGKARGNGGSTCMTTSNNTSEESAYNDASS